MKYINIIANIITIFTLLLLFSLAACQSQTPKFPAPGAKTAGYAYWDYNEEAATHLIKSEEEKSAIPLLNEQELGAIDFKIYAYGAQETRNTLAGTPLDYRVFVHAKGARSPPLGFNPDLSILLVSIKSNGETELFGTSNMPEVMPINVLKFDQATGLWVSQRGIAQGFVGTQRFILLVNLKGVNRMLQDTISVS